MDIDRYNGVKCNNQTSQHQGRPRTITCRLNNFKNKEQILNNAKKFNRYMYLHLQRFFKTAGICKKTLWEKVLQYQRQNKFGSLND